MFFIRFKPKISFDLLILVFVDGLCLWVWTFRLGSPSHVIGLSPFSIRWRLAYSFLSKKKMFF